MPADPTTLARIYDDVWGDLDGDPDRTASIVRDMEAIRDAADLDAACAAVAWWGDDVDGRQRERVARARGMMLGLLDVAMDAANGSEEAPMPTDPTTLRAEAARIGGGVGVTLSQAADRIEELEAERTPLADDELAASTDDLHAICPNCVSEESLADEERCCLSCGADLIVVADAYSCELLLDLLRPRASAAERFDAALADAIRRERPTLPPPTTIRDLDADPMTIVNGSREERKAAVARITHGIGDDANPTGSLLHLCLACEGNGVIGGRQCPECDGVGWVR